MGPGAVAFIGAEIRPACHLSATDDRLRRRCRLTL
jgi:hypothetical protein